MLSIRLPEELKARLEKFTALHKHSKSFYVKEAIESYLDDQEDADEAMSRMMDSGANYLSTEALLQALKRDV